MLIEKLICTNCGRQGYPGEEGFDASMFDGVVIVHCVCGNKISVTEIPDQLMLSTNIFGRLSAASNHKEYGEVDIIPGQITEIKFQRAFDFACKAFFTPKEVAIAVKELELKKDSMLILSSGWGNSSLETPISVKVSWSVYGLIDIDNLPVWYVHFYGAITQCENGLFKPALLDYAVAFETFIESYLKERLTVRYGDIMSEYLLRKIWRVEDRCKELLELAVGHRLSENNELFSSWKKYVQEPRNDLAHGKQLKIEHTDVENAHQAVYQAIRWVERINE